MDGKIFGIPLVLIVLVIVIVSGVVVPTVLLHRETVSQLTNVQSAVDSNSKTIVEVKKFIEDEATKSATLEVTPTPTKVFRVVTPTEKPTE